MGTMLVVGVLDGSPDGMYDIDGGEVGSALGAGDTLGSELGSIRIGMNISKREHVHLDGVPGYTPVRSQGRLSPCRLLLPKL